MATAHIQNGLDGIRKSLVSLRQLKRIKEWKLIKGQYWHARFDATLRAYEYIISFEKDAFGPDRVLWRHFRDLDFALLGACCAVIKKYNDFPSFCKSKQGSKTTIVNLQEIYWRKEGDKYILFISADRFIRGMVRLVVGAMMQVARGKMTLEAFESGIQKVSD